VPVLAYTDYVYRERGGVVYAERAFALFLIALGDQVGGLTIVGRLDPEPGPMHYPLPPAIRFVALPHYSSLADPRAAISALWRSLHRFWRSLDGADRIWVLGPQPHAVALALIGLLRRRSVVLGVRQDYPTYVRSRRPARPWLHRAADLLELCWRALARRCPVVVVGPELARRYRHAPRLLEIAVSLVSTGDIEAGALAAQRPYGDELQLLSVGRLDREKNPLLLADVLAILRRGDSRWRLVVCGEGPLESALADRLAELGMADHADLRGYVPLGRGLFEVYRASHAFLHVSLTEGMPQVLIEAFASGVPVVATAVGGVAAAVGEAALLIAPGNAAAAAAAVQGIAADAALRGRLAGAGLTMARSHTVEHETARVAAFIGPRRATGSTLEPVARTATP
jgi:glycosyltransferase involved in cell wall biosynthesis